MLNVEKLKEEAYVEIQRIAEDCSRKFCEQIHNEFPQHFPELRKKLIGEITSIYETYSRLEQMGQVGPLEWIYISFVRTGLMDRKPCYRIDFYDACGRSSDIECAGDWDFAFVFDHYYEAKMQILNGLKQQTRLKRYEIYDILYALSDTFRALSDGFMIQLINEIRPSLTALLPGGQGVRVMLGEFLDQAELVADSGIGGGDV